MPLLFHSSEKDQKSILVTDTQIHFSDKNHADLASFEKSLEKKGMLETLHSWEIGAISNFNHVAGQNTVTNKMHNKESLVLHLENAMDRDKYIAHVVGLKNFKAGEEAQKPLAAAAGPLVGMAFSLAITVGLFFLARSMEGGEEVIDTSGRRAGLKALLKGVLETLGPIGVAAVGGLITLYFGYKAYKIAQDPPNKVVYG